VFTAPTETTSAVGVVVDRGNHGAAGSVTPSDDALDGGEAEQVVEQSRSSSGSPCTTRSPAAMSSTRAIGLAGAQLSGAQRIDELMGEPG
jgi:hypothetical protein